jgi:uncharacterized surface protein with fasciclin (FAS1) repeats
MKNTNKILKFMLVAFLAMVTFSCSTSDDNTEVVVAKSSILDIAKSNPNLSSLVLALKASTLDVPGTSPLGSAGSYTVFAPVNAAFDAYISSNFPTGATASVLTGINTAVAAATPTSPVSPAVTAQIAELKKILQYHILGVATKADDLIPNSTSGYYKTFAPFVTPPTSSTPVLSMFVSLVNGNLVINGGSTNGGAKVTSADNLANNGVIHIIDSVLGLPTLANHVKANPDFSKLYAIITSTGGAFGNQAPVLAVLTGATAATPKTVFAPLNSALDAATMTGFLTPVYIAVPGNITKVLQYHVSASNSNLTATSATSWNTATVPFVFNTLAPVAQTFSIANGTVKITSAATGSLVSNIKVVNVQAVNGVIHAVDTVLQPN